MTKNPPTNQSETDDGPGICHSWTICRPIVMQARDPNTTPRLSHVLSEIVTRGIAMFLAPPPLSPWLCELIHDVCDAAAPVHLGSLWKQPLDLSRQRDSHSASLLVAGPSPLPRGRDGAAVHVAGSLPGEHALQQPVSVEVEIERYGGSPGRQGRASGRVVERRPDDTGRWQQSGRKPGRLGEIAVQGTRREVGRAFDMDELAQAHQAGEHGAPAVREPITDANREAGRHANARVPHEARGVSRDLLGRLEGSPLPGPHEELAPLLDTRVSNQGLAIAKDSPEVADDRDRQTFQL